jgi:uncharacterized protein (DUF2267 family)
MSVIGTFDKSAQKTNLWLRHTLKQLDWTDPQRAYTALRAVLHALRDRLPLAEVVQLGAQMPTFIRGMYYEGWNPARTPVKNRKKEAFLDQIRQSFKARADIDPEQVARAIIRLLIHHVSDGEMSEIKNSLPPDLRKYWPTPILLVGKAS